VDKSQAEEMKPNRQNKFVRFILRTIDVCVAFYVPRPVHWKDEPFQKATGTQWRLGWFFIACMPIFMGFFVSSNSIHSFVNSAGDGRHSVVWLYVGFIGIVLISIFCWLKIGPKVPLYVSIPVAIVAWIYCIWLLGFHSEKIIHSNANW
jgi:hypothetical protein